MIIQAQHLAPTQCILGEGPVWHDQALWFVDIEAHTLNRFDQTGIASFNAGERIGFAAPTNSADWFVGLQSGVARWNPARSSPRLVVSPEPNTPENRFNDGKADPTGRLYAGTMHMPTTRQLGALYRLEPDHSATPVVKNVTISNGLAWHQPSRSMYYIDTPTQRVARFEWDHATGNISNPSTVIKFDRSQGSPDGMTIDQQGNLYVAMWGGSAVLVVHPQRGEIINSIAVDAPHVTSCTFGGPDLSELYITTAKTGLSKLQLEESPSSGDLFVASVKGAAGHPVTPVHSA